MDFGEMEPFLNLRNIKLSRMGERLPFCFGHKFLLRTLNCRETKRIGKNTRKIVHSQIQNGFRIECYQSRSDSLTQLLLLHEIICNNMFECYNF